MSQLNKIAAERQKLGYPFLSKSSYTWFTKKISELKSPNRIPASLKREQSRYTTRFFIGSMYFFYYEPKTADKLPYYDTFPLVLMLERYPDGFLGLNLHYLPIQYRLAFMDKLYDYAVTTEGDDPKRIKISYEILSTTKRFKEFRPCIKRYSNTQIRSKILAVMPNEWETALWLPIQQFKKEKPRQVWQESVNEIKGKQ